MHAPWGVECKGERDPIPRLWVVIRRPGGTQGLTDRAGDVLVLVRPNLMLQAQPANWLAKTRSASLIASQSGAKCASRWQFGQSATQVQTRSLTSTPRMW